jgi:hypothetical protein
VKKIAWEDIDDVLAYAAEMDKIAQIAIEWRQVLHAGHYDEAPLILSRLAAVTDEYILSNSLEHRKSHDKTE